MKNKTLPNTPSMQKISFTRKYQQQLQSMPVVVAIITITGIVKEEAPREGTVGGMN